MGQAGQAGPRAWREASGAVDHETMAADGDLHPTTEAARLFAIGYVLSGIGILAAFASELTKHLRANAGLAERLGVT